MLLLCSANPNYLILLVLGLDIPFALEKNLLLPFFFFLISITKFIFSFKKNTPLFPIFFIKSSLIIVS